MTTTTTKEELSDEEIPENARCSICLEMFKDPRVLPCIHTFCLECLESCTGNFAANTLNCPLCRNICWIPPGGPRSLPSNVFINELLVNVKNRTIADKARTYAPVRHICEPCSNSEIEITSTSYCVECDQHFCEKCSSIHQKYKFFKCHRIVRENDLQTKRLECVFDACAVHPTELNEMYCYDCKAITCRKCLKSEHDRHKCADIIQSADVLSKQLKDDADALTNHAGWTREDIVQLERNMNDFSDNVSRAERNIVKKHAQWSILLRYHRDQLLRHVSNFSRRMTNKMLTVKDEMVEQLTTGDSLRTYCLETRNKGTACDISRTAHELHARVEELVKTPEKPYCRSRSGIEIAFVPSYPRFVHNIIGELVLEDEEVRPTEPLVDSEWW